MSETAPITISDCTDMACRQYGANRHDVVSHRRLQPAARVRQVAMWLAYKSTPRSLPQIGRFFLNRDHTTVMHAIARVEEMRAIDPAFRASTDQCLYALAGQDERQKEMTL